MLNTLNTSFLTFAYLIEGEWMKRFEELEQERDAPSYEGKANVNKH